MPVTPPTAQTSDTEVPQTRARESVVPLETFDQTRVVGAATVMMENVTAVRPVTVAVAVFVPVVMPVMNFAAAFPLASVDTVAGVTLPPPAVTAKATLTPDFGLLKPSVTCTRMESEKLAPGTTLVGSVPTLTMLFAGPATLAVEKVTGDPAKPATVAVTVLVPTALPSLKDVPASPDASVVAVVGVTEPPPAVAAKVTATPDTGLPNESADFTVTVLELPAVGVEGKSVPLVMFCAAAAETVINVGADVAVPALPVMFAEPTGPTAVTSPVELTVAMVGLSDE